MTVPRIHPFVRETITGELLNQIPLVGRIDELHAIGELASRGDGGAGAMVLVAGEGGVGKTRLVEAVSGRLSKNGWRVALGRAYPVESGVPFAIFSDALLPTLRSIEPSALAVLSRGGVAELKSIFPTLEGIGAAKAAADDPADFKARMLWNFSQLLGRLATKQPLLLVLENLQWADASSLELLHFVARHANTQRLLIVGTYNVSERDSNTVLKSTEQSLLKIGAATRISLSSLSASQVSEIIERTFEVAPQVVEKFSALLYGWTHGNPFFVEEILKGLIAAGHLHKTGTAWNGWNVESLHLPGTVRDAIEARLDRLSAQARDIAALASVVGTRVNLDTLSKISALTGDDLVSAVDELSSQRILHELPETTPAEYDFTHPLFQQVLYTGIGSARASVMHAKVAAALEHKYSRQSDAHADELAYHFARVHTPETSPKATRYLRIAGLAALARYANREAATYLRAALERADSSDASPDDVSSIVNGLARALQRIGEYREAAALWGRSREDATQSGDSSSVAFAEHRLGLGAYWSADLPAALAHFDAALSLTEDAENDALAVRIHLARAIVLQDIGEVESAKAGVERALTVAERSGDNILLARVHRALLLLFAWTGPKDSARAHGTRALEFSRASGQKMLEWTAHWGMSVLSGVSGDAPGVARHLRAIQSLNEELQSPILPIWTAEISVQYLSGIAEWEKGVIEGERAIEMARAFGQRSLLPRLLVWTALIHLWRGDSEKARPLIDEAWTLSRAGSPRRQGEIPSVVPAHHGMASLHLYTRNYADAIKTGEAGLEIADRAGYAAWALQWLLPVVGEAALWAKEWEKAEKHSRRMRSDAQRLDHPLGLAWADACDGLLIMLRDSDPAGGAVLLRRAAEKMDELQIPSSAAVLRRHLGRALIDSGDSEAARKELKRAHDVLARLGARAELDAVREQLRELGARPPGRVAAVGAAGLTGRELEIARMVSERKSNKEIGAALDISARTVSTHLSNVFAKLGVDSRGALTDFIRGKAL
ncbi:MAG: AAA family ATPase [Gemmatimonadaceae bacterium]|nr:AAA family ATPase [Gemmatimonadaceae bacterium]